MVFSIILFRRITVKNLISVGADYSPVSNSRNYSKALDISVQKSYNINIKRAYR